MDENTPGMDMEIGKEKSTGNVIYDTLSKQQLIEMVKQKEKEKRDKENELKSELSSYQKSMEIERNVNRQELQEARRKVKEAEDMVDTLSTHSIDITKIPNLEQIAIALGEQPNVYEAIFKRTPQKTVTMTEQKVATMIGIHYDELRDAGIDINGNGVFTNFNEMLEIVKKYPDSIHADEDFPETYARLVELLPLTFSHMEELWSKTAKIGNLQDVGRSIMIHYMVKVMGNDALDALESEEEEKEGIEKILNEIRELKEKDREKGRTIEELQEKLGIESEKESKKELEEISKDAEERLKDIELDEKEITEEAEADEGEEKKKKKKKIRL